uniref:Uncharacterized protein n=1 Tax=Geospiza parvula TaxID=87175 RepID=A0A8U8C331_GEOPR
MQIWGRTVNINADSERAEISPKKKEGNPLSCLSLTESPLLPFPRYFFPRQLLIRHFWIPRWSSGRVQNPKKTKDSWNSCGTPSSHPLLAVRSLFSSSLLLLNRLQVDHVRALSQVLFLTPHLPAFLLRRRLRSHVLEIRHLDHALLRLGPGQLSEEELRAACYLRGLNSTHLGRAECQAWLEQWLRLSCELQGGPPCQSPHQLVLPWCPASTRGDNWPPPAGSDPERVAPACHPPSWCPE